MIVAKITIKCPCSPDATIIAEPMVAEEKEADNFYVECCQCGRRYHLVVER